MPSSSRKRQKTSSGKSNRRKKAADNDVWNVHSLLDCRRSSDGGFEFLIRWENWDGGDSWEPEKNLLGSVSEEANLVKQQFLRREEQNAGPFKRLTARKLIQHSTASAARSNRSVSKSDTGASEPTFMSPSAKSGASEEGGTPREILDEAADVARQVMEAVLHKNDTDDSASKAALEIPEKPEAVLSPLNSEGQDVNSMQKPVASSAGESAKPAQTTASQLDNAEQATNEDESHRLIPPNNEGHNATLTQKPVASSEGGSADQDDKSEGDQEKEEFRRLKGLWPMLQKELKVKLFQEDPVAVKALAEIFPSSQYPAMNLSNHCVFCHKSFDSRFPEGCTMTHIIEKWKPAKGKAKEDCFTAQCMRCDESWEVSECFIRTIAKSPCFQQNHASDLGLRLKMNLKYDKRDIRNRITDQKMKPFDGCRRCFNEAFPESEEKVW